jgi:hypothetical protein
LEFGRDWRVWGISVDVLRPVVQLFWWSDHTGSVSYYLLVSAWHSIVLRNRIASIVLRNRIATHCTTCWLFAG